MNISAKLPNWAARPLTQMAAKEQPLGTQTGPMSQENFDQFSQGAVGMLNMAAMDEIEGQDMAMGQPGVVVPQPGLKLHFEGDVSSSSGEVTAVLDATEQGTAMYLRSGPTGFDMAAVQQTPQGATIVQGGYVEAGPMGMSGYIVAGQV